MKLVDDRNTLTGRGLHTTCLSQAAALGETRACPMEKATQAATAVTPTTRARSAGDTSQKVLG